MEKTMKELYREQYQTFSKLSQEEIEELYLSEGIEFESIKNQLDNLKQIIERKKDELPSEEDRLMRAIFGEDLRVQKELEEIKILEEKCLELERMYKSLSSQIDFNLDIEEMLKSIKYEIVEKRKIIEENNSINMQKKEDELNLEIKELENKYEKLRSQYNNFYKQFHKVVRGLCPNTRKYPSHDLRNKIVEGTLGIASYWATVYYKKSDNTQSFDDLHQIANLALISAAHYYVPSDRAKFATYARKCIENQLKKAVYKSKKMKKRPYKAQDFFQKEKDLIKYVKMFLEATTTVSENRISEYYFSILKEFRDGLREFNRNLRLFGDTKRSFQSFSYSSLKQRDNFDKVIYNVINILRNSKLKELLSEEEIELTNLWLNYTNKLTPLNELLYYLDIYIGKLERIEEYVIIEKELQEKNDGITPTLDDILEEFNKRIKYTNQEKYHLKKEGFYKKSIVGYKEPENYYGVYMDEYNVDPFISADDYEDSHSGLISKQKEKDDILEEFEEFSYEVDNCLKTIDFRCLEDNDKVIIFYSDSEYSLLKDCDAYDYYVNSDITEKFYKILPKSEAIEELNRLKQYYENSDEYLKKVLKERKNYVNSIINETNKDIYAYNRECKIIRAKYFDGPNYKKYLKKEDIFKIKNDIEILYGNDLELFILLNGNNKSKTDTLSVEDEALNNLFMRDYYAELNNLSSLEREVLLKYFDSNGQHSLTAKEIGSELGITSNRVYKEKTKALKKLQSSKIMQSYLEE